MSTDIVATPATPLNGLATTNGIFTTVKGDDFETKRKIFSAVNDAVPATDLEGKPFQVSDVVMEPVEFTNEKTGEIETTVRTIFITPDGQAYQVFSGPVFNAVKRLLSLIGEPSTWPEPISVRLTEEGRGTNRYLKLTLV